MVKYVVCEKCHKAKLKTEVETVIGKTYKNRGYSYYCKDCMQKILKYEEVKKQWEEEKNRMK